MTGPSKEVYRIQDPKRSSWLKSFPMKQSRGFFDAAVFQGRVQFKILIFRCLADLEFFIFRNILTHLDPTWTENSNVEREIKNIFFCFLTKF